MAATNPTGPMEGELARVWAPEQAAGFAPYDLADEEVHFSRDQLGQGPPVSLRQPLEASLMGAPTSSGSFLSAAAPPSELHSERLRSSRLLSSIGSRLRRGSNYLAAPKLVGQYLLGVTVHSWTEFFDTSRLLRAPSNRHQLARRLVANLSRFQGNYLCLAAVLVLYCILTSPLLLLALAGYLLALYLATARSALGKQTRLLGFRLNLQQQYSFLTLVSLPLLWVAGAPSALFWVLGATFFVVGLHAAMFAGELPPDQLAGSGLQQVAAGQRPLAGPGGPCAGYYSHQAHYISLPPSVASAPASANPGPTLEPPGYAHWILFGAAGRPRPEPAGSGQQPATAVKIISQDYAGLGRVYEV